MASPIYNEVRLTPNSDKIYFGKGDIDSLKEKLFKIEPRDFGDSLRFRITKEADVDFYFKKEKGGYLLEGIFGDVDEDKAKIYIGKIMSITLRDLSSNIELNISGYEKPISFTVGDVLAKYYINLGKGTKSPFNCNNS